MVEVGRRGVERERSGTERGGKGRRKERGK